MNTTTRTGLRVLIAAPLAALALGVGAGAADAADDDHPFRTSPGVVDPKGPGEIANPDPDDDPEPHGPGDIANPDDDEDPKPQGPGEITNPEGEDEPGPQVPDDKVGPNPGDDPDLPDGPDDIAIPEDGVDPGDETPADKPGKKAPGAKAPGNKKGADKSAQTPDVTDEAPADVQLPNRIDAGAGATESEGLELAWVLAGGGLVTAAGSLLARRRLARRTR